jgi:hypothetical protein
MVYGPCAILLCYAQRRFRRADSEEKRRVLLELISGDNARNKRMYSCSAPFRALFLKQK